MTIEGKKEPPPLDAKLVADVRKKWDAFEGSLRKSLERAIDLGKSLLAAKEKCGHGNFEMLFSTKDRQGEIPCSSSWARKVMTMASNPAISNRSHANDLPADLETVYQLATMTAPALEAAIEDGRVTPDLTRKEAKALRREVEGDDEKPRKSRAKADTCDRDERDIIDDLESSLRLSIRDVINAYPHLRQSVAGVLRGLLSEVVQ